MRSLVRLAPLVAVYLLVATIQTAPLIAHLTTSIPFGNDVVPTIARLNLWTLWWNDDRLWHCYRGYWQAPIFHPEPNSFVYSETQWLTGLVASPLWSITANPALTYDVIVLTALVLSGLGGYVLLRRLGIPAWCAVSGGLIMEMLPTTVDQIGVLQSVTVVFPILMTLANIVRFAETGSGWSALGIGLWMAAFFHTSSNMALFFAPMVVLGVVVVATRQLLRPRAAAALALGALLAALTVAPIAVVQARVLATIAKISPYTPAEIAGTSAHFGTYAHMAPTNVLRRRPPDRKEATLSPGIALLAAGVLGVFHGFRRRRLRRWTFYSVMATFCCVVLSFGPVLANVPLGTVLSAPYTVMRAYYPGFRFARNLWRFGGLGQVFLGTLAAFGVAACCSGFRRRWHAGLLGVVVTAAIATDLLATPIPLLDLGKSPSQLEWVQWLRNSPPETTIVHIPMPVGTTAENFERTTYWMDCQMHHGRRIANGYAAYIPSRTALLMQVMPNFPDAQSLRALEYFGIEYVAADRNWITPERTIRIEQWRQYVVPEVTAGDVMIYRIAGARAAPAS